MPTTGACEKALPAAALPPPPPAPPPPRPGEAVGVVEGEAPGAREGVGLGLGEEPGEGLALGQVTAGQGGRVGPNKIPCA